MPLVYCPASFPRIFEQLIETSGSVVSIYEAFGKAFRRPFLNVSVDCTRKKKNWSNLTPVGKKSQINSNLLRNVRAGVDLIKLLQL